MSLIGLKRPLGRLASLRHAKSTRHILLYYHSVGNGPNAISQAVFADQIEWLARHADVLPIGDFLAGLEHQAICVSIGFDDGYASVLEHAEPILSAYNIQATVYVNTGWISEGSRRVSDAASGHYPGEFFMSCQDVRHLVQRGWTIGSHGVEHLDLTSVRDESLHAELHDSKRLIEDRLGVACHHFAYTWGRYNRKVKKAVMHAGYLSAASAIHGPVDKNSDLFALPRIDIAKSYSIEDFKAIVRGDWDFLGTAQAIRRFIKLGI